MAPNSRIWRVGMDRESRICGVGSDRGLGTPKSTKFPNLWGGNEWEYRICGVGVDGNPGFLGWDGIGILESQNPKFLGWEWSEIPHSWDEIDLGSGNPEFMGWDQIGIQESQIYRLGWVWDPKIPKIPEFLGWEWSGIPNLWGGIDLRSRNPKFMGWDQFGIPKFLNFWGGN
ncbi:hypothetical protein HGM15179_021079 [Zosterops borbonicus]|uniref:Uncharacterized protein n=1 Tax=Zosterops borbonicus TaxID=364589 RepID=A0A8K1D6K2_9PASS|nr:hypothetical protein HGM15179_021079 [Zosterops borbonicus]